MKKNRLKLYLGGLALIAALSASNVQVAYATEDEEVLYTETNDDYKLEDNNEEVVTEINPEGNQVQEVVPESDNKPTLTEEGKDTEEQVFDPNDTTIDKEDEKYNTGREEIPDDVETEYERKIGKPTPPEEDTPEENTPEENTPVEEKEKEKEEIIVIPKTGTVDNLVPFVVLGGTAGAGFKIVTSRKKYTKKSKRR